MAGPNDTETDPVVALLETAEGMYAADTLAALLVHLNLGDLLAEGPTTLDDLRQKTRLSAEGAEVATTLLASYGLLTRDTEKVTLTIAGQQLLPAGSSQTLQPLFEPIAQRQQCREMLAALTGAAPGPGEQPEPQGGRPPDDSMSWLEGMTELDFAKYFLYTTDSRNRVLAEALTAAVHPCGANLLDAAAGSGIYSASLLRAHADLRATLLERPPVTDIAAENLAEFALGERVDVRAGNLLADDLPSGFSDILVSNVIHDWKPDQLAVIFANCRKALEPGGQIILHDVFLGLADRDGDRRIAEYSPLLLRFTRGRCYHFDEIVNLLKATGFTNVSSIPTTAHRQVVTATRGNHDV